MWIYKPTWMDSLNIKIAFAGESNVVVYALDKIGVHGSLIAASLEEAKDLEDTHANTRSVFGRGARMHQCCGLSW